jgi:hypothetical protein
MYRGVFAYLVLLMFVCPVFAFILRQGSMFSYEKCTVVYLLTLPSVANACSCPPLTLCPVSFYRVDVFICKICCGVFAYVTSVANACSCPPLILFFLYPISFYVKGSMLSYAKCAVVYLLTLPRVANACSCPPLTLFYHKAYQSLKQVGLMSITASQLRMLGSKTLKMCQHHRNIFAVKSLD